MFLPPSTIVRTVLQVLNTWYTFIKSTAEHVTINSDPTTATSTVSGDSASSEQQQQAGAASGTTFIAEAEGGARPVAIPGRGRKQSMQLKIDVSNTVFVYRN